MLTTVAEPGRTLEANEEYDLPDREARDLCARPEGFPRAEPVAVKAADKRQTRRRAPENVR